MAFSDWIVQHWRAILLVVVVVAWVGSFALVAFKPWVSRLLPRVAIYGWPLLALGPLLLGILIFSGLWLISLISRFWSSQEGSWSFLIAKWSGFRLLDWLWPWLPVLLVSFFLLYLAARFLSRRYFHFSVLAGLACGVLAVALHDEPEPDLLSEGVLLQAKLRVAPRLPPWEESPRGREAADDPWDFIPHRGRLLSLMGPGVPAGEERKFTHFLGGRIQRRIIEPTMHAPQVAPDPLFLAVMGLLLLAGYRALEGVNASRNLPSIEVGAILDTRPARNGSGGAAGGEDSEGTAGPGRRAHEIGQLLMKYLSENSPHIPPRVPGGAPLYWESLMEAKEAKPDTWYAKVLALLMHFFLQPSTLRLTGTLICREMPGGEDEGKAGLRVELTDTRTHETRFVDTFWAQSFETAARNAAYAVAEVAMERCPTIPEWASFRRTRGAALMSYQDGCSKLTLDVHPHPLCKSEDAEMRSRLVTAREAFEKAARLNPGNGNMKIQYAEVLELENRFVEAMLLYLETFQRYPRVLLAKYRFGIACSYVDRWVASLSEGENETELWTRLKRWLDPPRRKCWGYRFWKWLQCGFVGKPVDAGRRLKDLKPWVEQDRKKIERFFLELSEQMLSEVIRAIDFRVMFWLRNMDDRRLFLAAVAWPPRLQRATRTAIIAARCCVLLRLKPHESKLREDNNDETNKRMLRRLSKVETRADALSNESLGATRLRGRFWGLAHYHLACFYALQLGSGNSDELAKKAITHLKRSIQDPEGPFASSEGTFASGSLWWVQQDPNLDALRDNRGGYWKEIKI